MSSEPDHKNLISRREAILRVSAMLGGVALVGQSAMLAGCAESETGDEVAVAPHSLFKQSEIALLDEIADTILPETSTPGAKAAGVGPFIAMMVVDTYYEADQQIVRDGLNSLQALCQDSYGADFQNVTAAERLMLVEKLDAEQHAYMENREEGASSHYFRMLKELTLLGYFTSEIGYTQAMRYAETPGQYDPCAPYAPGDKSWADHA
ncbi:MAG: gluconate 2-dehydrogenase subunit 3 family protein [Woeseiaceae bacterium]